MTTRRNDKTTLAKRSFCDVRCAMCVIQCNTQYAKRNTQGFTLIELIVSVTITAIIMVGVSAFFASSFHNIFTTQEKLDESQGNFNTNNIIREKLTGVEEIINMEEDSDIVVRNNTENGDLPFTYIAKVDNELVFKDFFIFNGMYEDKVSKDFSPITNPGGITFLNSNYYIAAPLENSIYKCSSESSCSVWLDSDLDHPTDITNDGTSLIVSDSGNDRVVKIDMSKNITEFPFELNFPTGAAYKSPDLYVSDTYNNRVVRIYEGGSKMAIVAGNGDNEACDTSPKLCKLNFPTGLVFSGDGKSLFISDTGNNRILKITDPVAGVDLFDQEITFNIPTAQKISKIDFTFPQGTDTSLISVDINPIHPGIWISSGNKLSLYMSVPLIKGDATDQDCSEVTGSEPCPIYFKRFTVNPNNNIFENGNDIIIKTETYTVDGVPSGIGSPITEYQVNVVSNTNEISYAPGTIVTIDSNYDDNKTFEFDLSLSNIPSGFNPVKTDIYDEDNLLTVSTSEVIRVGDGIIGTEEDTIEVITYGGSYPTGLGWDSEIQVSDMPVYSKNFSEYDYESGFEITSIQFSEPNPGAIMQVDIETANGDEYVINSALN